MRALPGYLLILTLSAILFAACGGKSKEAASPEFKLQVAPLPSAYIHYDSESSIFRIGNELIERQISVNAETRRVFTTSFVNKISRRNYMRSLSKEFSFRANGAELSGVTGGLEYMEHEMFGAGGVKGIEITFRTMLEEIGFLKLRLIYEIYPHIPVIRKWMEIENQGSSAVTVDSMQVESLNLLPGSEYDVEVYDGSRSSIAGVVDTRLAEGFLIGNEAPGVLKYSKIYSDRSSVSIGMKPYFQSYAAGIQLAPKEKFTSPAAFILFFKGDPQQAKEILREFIAEYMARSKSQTHSVWYENITTDTAGTEARAKVQLALESGADIFCVNRGWAVNEDDQLQKFGDHAHDLGMKLGLSMELALADPGSQIVDEYPQWVVKSRDGSDYTVGDGKLMCLGSEYTLYIVHQIDALVRDLELDYVRLTGPMIPDEENGGCFAEEHVHRSNAESLWYIYEGVSAICRYLHAQHPKLIIDIPAESYNPGGTVDYALLKCADVEWPF